ncbi:MAG: polyketide synthase dehydratase domain-containing protein [Candidatus Electrothrix aestuarii]|uniref:Polyketide synthase dehydratase domain-containing protein n=1 Tax=Candidatus Electrothrix aestuarii TaxID=3062594 RepID=A0AAU8LZB1_9BACT|nr:polyketide synthase dehydratase domain-containing protein [Candidatus Electrothrix aestuarii]
MSNERLPVTLSVQPWFQDHSFTGTIVLPAVESLLLLVAQVAKAFPGADISVMEDMRFAKFLEIPPEATELDVLVEFSPDGDRVGAQLLTRKTCGKMSRIKEHSQVFFPLTKSEEHPPSRIDPTQPANPLLEIPVEQLYRELVPFGRQYQTLQDTLFLHEDSAWAVVKAPALPFIYTVQEQLGSPFPLDGAMHAASVLGQQKVDFTPLPVGIDQRIILRPTQPDGEYLTKVSAVVLSEKELVFDLLIFDGKGLVYEVVKGLRMRDTVISSKSKGRF